MFFTHGQIGHISRRAQIFSSPLGFTTTHSPLRGVLVMTIGCKSAQSGHSTSRPLRSVLFAALRSASSVGILTEQLRRDSVRPIGKVNRYTCRTASHPFGFSRYTYRVASRDLFATRRHIEPIDFLRKNSSQHFGKVKRYPLRGSFAGTSSRSTCCAAYFV